MILGFNRRFVPAVADGRKPHTIRAGHRWKPGMTIQFYMDVRQLTMRKFRADAVVQVVQDFELELLAPARRQWVPHVDGRPLTPLEAQELAVRDGFGDYRELLDWFRKVHGLPFYGQLIGWTSIRY